MGGRRRFAFGGDEAGVAPLPSFKLAIEKGAPCRVIREGRQMAVHPREEAESAVWLLRAAACCRPREPLNCVVAEMRHLSPGLYLLVRWHSSASGAL